MVRLTSIQKEYGQDIGDIIDDLTVLTPLNHLDLKNTFTEKELSELRQNLVEVRKATTENEKTAKLMEQGTKVLKLLQKIGFDV